ncbi:hypothetical protein SDJN03_27078, partial [Cucurbita argyrosperma subsp. sororia]
MGSASGSGMIDCCDGSYSKGPVAATPTATITLHLTAPLPHSTQDKLAFVPLCILSMHVASKRTPIKLIYVGPADVLEFDPINPLGSWSNLWTIRDLSRGLASLPPWDQCYGSEESTSLAS